jgi:hypothetical protein
MRKILYSVSSANLQSCMTKWVKSTARFSSDIGMRFEKERSWTGISNYWRKTIVQGFGKCASDLES